MARGYAYAEMEYVSIRTYLSKIEYVRYVSSSLGTKHARPLCNSRATCNL